MKFKNLFKEEYFKATGLFTLGSIFDKAISLLMLPVFTRLLDTTSYGMVSTYNSWVGIATVIVSVQLFSSMRSAFTDYKGRIEQYTSAVNSMIVVAFVIVLALSVAICKIFSISIPIVLVILCIVQSFMAALLNVETQREMMSLDYLKRTLLISLPNLIAAIIGIIVLLKYPESGQYGRIVPMVIVYCAFGITLLVKEYLKGHTFYNKEIWAYAFAFSAPLVFHGLASTVLGTMDRTMITAMRSASETGIYSVAYTLGMAVLVITSALESVWVPWFTRQMNAGEKKKINFVASKYIIIVSALCVVAELCLPEILTLFSDKSYWGGITLIPPIVLASYAMFLYSLSVDLEYYKKSTKRIAINTIIAAVLNLVLNYIFIPKFGAVAAAYSTVASYFVSFILHYLYARKLDGELFNLRIYLLPMLFVVFGTIFTYCVIDIWWIRWASAALVIGVIVYIIMKNMKVLSDMRPEEKQ